MGETRVDLLHLLEDLRDAYPASTEETILTEIVANALDSGANTIVIATEPSVPSLSVVDDGVGMRRRELARYHDVAASTKARGAGIGFAGVGIKIALLICTDVVTETRRGKHHVASSWRLASRHKAPWHWIPPPGLVGVHGTAVRLTLASALSPLVDVGFIEDALRRNFTALLDPRLAEVLRAHYPRGVTFVVNGRPLRREHWRAQDSAPLAVHVGRKRKPVAAGYLERNPSPLPEPLHGLAASTFGKVIKRGWEWLGIAPAEPERLGGVIEAPALADCLTLNKADFIRVGSRGATYLAYRKAIQEAVSRQLADWGHGTERAEYARRRTMRPLERDLARVLSDLADDFPLLEALMEQRGGGQRRLSVGTRGDDDTSNATLLPALHEAARTAIEHADLPDLRAAPMGTDVEPTRADAGQSSPTPATGSLPRTGARTRRPARYGLNIQFEERSDSQELGHLVESTVWINTAHPAYLRALVSRGEGYHVALAVAVALATVAVDPATEHAFITAFLARWGSAADRRARQRVR